MPPERKKGQLKLEGANAMVFVETDEAHADAWTPEEEAAANAVAKAIKCYIETTEALTGNKYQHLRDSIPEYMVNPGNYLVAVCTDGIVVRYEKKTEERKGVVAVFPQPIGDVAALLSQDLVHIESPDAPHLIKEKFGAEFKLTVHSPSQGSSHDLVAARIWFQAKTASSQHPEPPGSKPYCLLSVRNQLHLELHGVIGSEGDATAVHQPFIARSTIRLIAGWECIEVFPGLDI